MRPSAMAVGVSKWCDMRVSGYRREGALSGRPSPAGVRCGSAAAGGRAYLPALRQGQVEPPGTWLTCVGVRRCRVLTFVGGLSEVTALPWLLRPHHLPVWTAYLQGAGSCRVQVCAETGVRP